MSLSEVAQIFKSDGRVSVSRNEEGRDCSRAHRLDGISKLPDVKRDNGFETLFTNPEPSSYGFRKHAEGDFHYLNSHADPPVIAARQLHDALNGVRSPISF